jgi:4-diphosphocytidyl-2-C-methyl-D-erythritol kinase
VTRTLRLLAPAKINWTLEVLRKRPDGYHEIRSVLQTIDLCDRVIVSDAAGIELALTGDAGSLADEPAARNLAVRAANALRARMGVRSGVRIEIEKRIPIAAGLGGGSSDAGAVLRGCNLLWETHQDDANLCEIAGEVGSDPPFFAVAGTASASGRGEIVSPLSDAAAREILIATPREQHRAHKTAAMYGALTPTHYTEGEATLELEDIVRAGRPIVDADITNVFEQVTATELPEAARAMAALRDCGLAPHLAGSGPSFFLLLDDDGRRDETVARVAETGFVTVVARPLARAEALRVDELR